MKVNVLRDYKVIPLEEDEKRLKLLAPEGYDFFLLEELTSGFASMEFCTTI